MNKSEIHDHFDQAAFQYDRYAMIQEKTSQYLAKISSTLSWPIQSILDVGCGTGNTAKAFAKYYQDSSITLCDLSKNMIQTALTKLPAAHFIIGDAERIHFDFYDLCISNLAFQWFENLEKFLSNITQKCRYLAFSTLVKGSFADFENLFPENMHFPYYTSNQILSLLQKCGSLRVFKERSYDMPVVGAINAARYFKQIGAQISRTPQSSLCTLLANRQRSLNLKHNVMFACLECC